MIETYDSIGSDVERFLASIKDLKKFDFDPKWHTRVVLVPQAIEGMQDLFDIIIHGFRDKFEDLHQALLELNDALHHKHTLRTSAGGAALVGAMVEEVGNTSTALRAFRLAFKDAVDIVAMLDDVKKRVETLDDLFLPQTNPRKYVTEKLRKRIRS